jgi:predicted thioesterase
MNRRFENAGNLDKKAAGFGTGSLPAHSVPFAGSGKKRSGLNMQGLSVGSTHEMSMTVTPNDTAKHLETGSASVLSTPSMVRLVEHAAQVFAQMHLPPGQTTVGAEVLVRHLAPTPLGMKVTVTVRVEQFDGRRIVFAAEVFDEMEKVGEGRHVRVIVDEKRFMDKVAAKRPVRS